MFQFNRKQRNRRLGHIRVLDVKLRSGQVRARRMRLAALALGVAFGTVLGLYLLWRTAEWTLACLVYENPSFAIQQVEVQTDGVITADQLRRWAGVRLGQNLIALDLAAVKRNLELASIIKSAYVERVLPRTLRIRVSEREPVARINVPGLRPRGGIEVVVFQLDTEGCVLQPLDPRQRVTPLSKMDDTVPVLTGLGASDLRPGRHLETPQVQAALELIEEFDSSPMAGLVELKRIEVGYPEILIVTTEQGSEVTFALHDMERQLQRWWLTHENARRMKRAIASLNLAVTNNSPVTWLETGDVPSTARNAAKPSRTKRKNV
jgi:hypothetical protein